jgi:AcrR family transcriptional regulator
MALEHKLRDSMSSARDYDSSRTQDAQPAGAEPRMRADARRNREQILAAAREIFADQGPDAPLEEIARLAGVGIGTLYRRFLDRPSLLRAVALDVLGRVAEEARLALAEEPDGFQALARYMHRALSLRIGAVMPALISQLAPQDAELIRARDAASAPIQLLIDTAHADGTLRSDVEFADISLLIVRLSRPLPGQLPRALDDRLAHRHLELLIAGLAAANERAGGLPGPAMTLADLRGVPAAEPNI